MTEHGHYVAGWPLLWSSGGWVTIIMVIRWMSDHYQYHGHQVDEWPLSWSSGGWVTIIMVIRWMSDHYHGHQVDGWPLSWSSGGWVTINYVLALGCIPAQWFLSQNSVRTLQKSFGWDYTLRPSMCIYCTHVKRPHFLRHANDPVVM